MAKQGGVEVWRRLSVHERARKPAPFLRGRFFISLVEVPTLSTSPKVAKSRMWAHSQIMWVWTRLYSQIIWARSCDVLGQDD
jgi:hypothetical protein